MDKFEQKEMKKIRPIKKPGMIGKFIMLLNLQEKV